MPRFRFTLRRMMVAVAILGIALAIERSLFVFAVATADPGGENPDWRDVLFNWMSINLSLAFITGSLTFVVPRILSYPWLPVAPDTKRGP